MPLSTLPIPNTLVKIGLLDKILFLQLPSASQLSAKTIVATAITTLLELCTTINGAYAATLGRSQQLERKGDAASILKREEPKTHYGIRRAASSEDYCTSAVSTCHQ